MATRKTYLLRVPPELFSALQSWADDEFRSVNAQIEFLLTDAVRAAGRRGSGALAGAESVQDSSDPASNSSADDDSS